MDTCFPFVLVTRLGHHLVEFSDNAVSSLARSSVLVVEESDNIKQFLQFFSQQARVVTLMFVIFSLLFQFFYYCTA